MAGKIHDVTASGHAPKDAGVGDYVKTSGGTYEILDPNKYSGMSTEQLKQSGVGYNPSTGLYSKKSSASSNAGGYAPVSVNFDSNAWKQSYIDKMVAELTGNYNTEKNAIEKAYNKNQTNFSDQKATVNNNYNTAVEDLNQEAYMNNVLGKQFASQQGLSSAAQGIALSQNIINKANEESINLFKSREETLAGIDRELNRLTADYDVDMNTLKSQFNTKKLSAMSDAELQALEYQLKTDTQNANTTNEWNLTKYQTENSNKQAQKDRDLEIMLKKMAIAASRGSGSGGKSSSNSSGGANEKDLASASTYMQYLANKYGNDWKENLSPEKQLSVDNASNSLNYGEISFDEYKQIINRIINTREDEKNTSNFTGLSAGRIQTGHGNTSLTDWLGGLFDKKSANKNNTSAKDYFTRRATIVGEK